MVILPCLRPWLGHLEFRGWLFFDGDAAGLGYVGAISERDFTAAEVAQRCSTLPAGTLEQQLLADGLEPDLRAILQTIGQGNALTVNRAGLDKCLDDNKTRYAAELSARLSTDSMLAPRMPQAFRKAITGLMGLT
jgi:putative ATP-dependent endonuclease of OLD family